MRKASYIAPAAAVIALVGTSALADGIFGQSSYSQTTSFDGSPGQLLQTSMNMTYDGNHYWSASGGSSNGNRVAEWDGSGNWIASYQPNLDMRSIFTVGGVGSTVYARQYSNPTIYRQTSPGVFSSFVTLSGGSLDAQSQVEFNSAGTEFIAHKAGTITRWNLSGTFQGTVSLSGWGGMFGEGTYPQDRGVISAAGYYLTYSNGSLSAWDASGNRVGTTTLTGAGSTFDSHFSLSWANNMVWVIDVANGTWRGYQIPELVGGFLISVNGICPGRLTVSWFGGTPNHSQGLVFGNNLGSTTIPQNQPCAGTQLGIAGNVHLLNPPGIFNNQGGQGSISGNAGTAACNHYLQMVEGGTCIVSNVANIP